MGNITAPTLPGLNLSHPDSAPFAGLSQNYSSTNAGNFNLRQGLNVQGANPDLSNSGEDGELEVQGETATTVTAKHGAQKKRSIRTSQRITS